MLSLSDNRSQSVTMFLLHISFFHSLCTLVAIILLTLAQLPLNFENRLLSYFSNHVCKEYDII